MIHDQPSPGPSSPDLTSPKAVEPPYSEAGMFRRTNSVSSGLVRVAGPAEASRGQHRVGEGRRLAEGVEA